MSGLEFSSFVHLGWKKGKRAEARFLFLVTLRLYFSFFLSYAEMNPVLNF